jgi:hypothetical protein
MQHAQKSHLMQKDRSDQEVSDGHSHARMGAARPSEPLRP